MIEKWPVLVVWAVFALAANAHRDFVTGFVTKLIGKMGLKVNDDGHPYKEARFVESDWRTYIDFSVWDVSKGKLVRKIFSKIPGNSATDKRRNGKAIVKELNRALARGYVLGLTSEAPWEQVMQPRAVTLKEAIEPLLKKSLPLSKTPKTGGFLLAISLRKGEIIGKTWGTFDATTC